MTVEVLLTKKKPTLADAVRKYEETNGSRVLAERRSAAKFKRFTGSNSNEKSDYVAKREPKSPIIKKVREIQKAHASNRVKKRPPKQRSISLIDATEMQSRITALQSKLSFKASGALPSIIERKSEPRTFRDFDDRNARRSVERMNRIKAARMDKEKRKQVDLINKLKHNIIKSQNGRYTFTSKQAPEVPPIIRKGRWQPAPHRMLVPPPERPPGMRRKSWGDKNIREPRIKKNIGTRRKSWGTTLAGPERDSSAPYQPRHPPPRRHRAEGLQQRKPYTRRDQRRRGIGLNEQRQYTPNDKRSPVDNARHRNIQNSSAYQRSQIRRRGFHDDYRSSYEVQETERSLSASPLRMNLPPAIGINQQPDDYLYPFYATEEPYSYQHDYSNSEEMSTMTSGGAENFRIVALNGLKVRTSYDLRSPEIAILPRGTIVTVVERVDRRYRIVAPVHGWVSYKTTAGQIGLEQVELACYMDSAYDSESRSRIPSNYNSSRSRTPLGSERSANSPHRVAPKKEEIEDIIGKRKEGTQMKYYCVKDGGQLEWLSSKVVPQEKIMEYEFRVSRSFGY